MPRLLFHRDFTEYTGGHGKVWDYFRHAQALGWDARVYLTPRSLRDASNPWMQCPQYVLPQWQPEACDVLFLAGMDWAALPNPQQPPRPVINLLQHVRHAWPEHPLRAFLSAPARRICVSQPVADAVLATGAVNGVVTVIPAALDLPPSETVPTKDGVLIAGLKAVALAEDTAQLLRQQGVPVEVLTGWLPRAEYLRKVAAAQVLLALPHPEEGFYLPALEGMALGVPVVTTDSIGSREYVRAGSNCLLAERQASALAEAALGALQPTQAAALQRAGHATASGYGQAQERARFADVLQALQAEVG